MTPEPCLAQSQTHQERGGGHRTLPACDSHLCCVGGGVGGGGGRKGLSTDS